MTRRMMLNASTLLAVLLFTLHTAMDMLRGFEPGTLVNAPMFAISTLWLYAALVMRGRVGYGLALLGFLLGMLMTYAHLRGAGVGQGTRVAESGNAELYVFTLLALGVVSSFATVLAARGLAKPQWIDEA